MLNDIGGSGEIRIKLEERPGGEGVSADYGQYIVLADEAFRVGGPVFEYCGDRVMQIVNDYSFVVFNQEEQKVYLLP